MKRNARIIVSVMLVMALSSGCGVIKDVAEVSKAVNVDKENGEITVKGEDGASVSASLEGGELPEGFPEEIFVPDDAVVVNGMKMVKPDKGATFIVTLTTAMSVKDSGNRYRELYDELGFAAPSEFSGNGAITLQGESETHIMTVIIGLSNEGPESSINLTYGPKG